MSTLLEQITASTPVSKWVEFTALTEAPVNGTNSIDITRTFAFIFCVIAISIGVVMSIAMTVLRASPRQSFYKTSPEGPFDLEENSWYLEQQYRSDPVRISLPQPPCSIYLNHEKLPRDGPIGLTLTSVIFAPPAYTLNDSELPGYPLARPLEELVDDSEEDL
ncbi:hypothetical protein NEOLI_003628 [Neolecta irregularis DAH-3]|uniref:Uncharacterized protein n=1 Tax=Neolecta irregularis (strain DAH-3) TaxID=1198029 RepID=A0A1U7LHI7_NEOID|nr:hypothetical protein NEOLI_003628 [Neolecta irregularis DAH-3]|eukprot:OLL22012.1 hypothetical protein NEOLI_003628 [Neolecta irregularis DAH-3]